MNCVAIAETNFLHCFYSRLSRALWQLEESLTLSQGALHERDLVPLRAFAIEFFLREQS